jgi:hypothetical protein
VNVIHLQKHDKIEKFPRVIGLEGLQNIKAKNVMHNRNDPECNLFF